MSLRELVTWRPFQRRRRAVVKTLCYRLFMVLITVGVAFFVTGNTADAISIGLVTNVAKTFTYYGYERVWDHIAWGVASD
ncbi:DUF2061 domain-containing protein [Saliphagus sp. LR7]|uniref:DUF2061 domain-containing protein n=1 Tax=Saliphagus sp. LR7 TaxID=2282654 RepID=UPI000DF7F53E|nr:DUF2061 domain-containing protein [Saliphagus sp. LR7]